MFFILSEKLIKNHFTYYWYFLHKKFLKLKSMGDIRDVFKGSKTNSDPLNLKNWKKNFFQWSHNTFDIYCRSFCNWATAKFLESKKNTDILCPKPINLRQFFLNSFIKTSINYLQWEYKFKPKNSGLYFHPLLKYCNFSFFCNIYPISLLFNLPLWSFII